jgi:hypothetical protein
MAAVRLRAFTGIWQVPDARRLAASEPVWKCHDGIAVRWCA